MICKHFAKGNCRYGPSCRFSHDLSAQNTVCEYFKKGNCRFGTRCRNSHQQTSNVPDEEHSGHSDSDDEEESEDQEQRYNKIYQEMFSYGLKPWNLEDWDEYYSIKDAFKKHDEEEIERSMNYGFNQDELDELAAQGINPWDSDAEDAINVIYGNAY